MPQVEVLDTALICRAEDAGYQGVVLEGALRFDPRPDGVAIVVDLTPTKGLESDWIVGSLRGTISRMLLSSPAIVRHGSIEASPLQRNTQHSLALKRLPTLRSIHERSLAGPRLVRP